MSELVMSWVVPLCKMGTSGAQFSSGAERRRRRMKSVAVSNEMRKPVTYSSRISTNIPLYESPVASFDQYLEEKTRVFKAIFPEKRRSHKLNADEWRVQMLPIEIFLLTVYPIVDMRLRYKSGGIDYPLDIPRDITKVVQLDIIRWELQGLDEILKPSEFTLGVKGALYPDRRGTQTRLSFRLQVSISYVLSHILALVPDNVCKDVADSVLKGMVVNMKGRVNGSLLADYSEFKKEKLQVFG